MHMHYLHVYVTGMPVSITQDDSTFDLLACNLGEGTRGATKPACVLKTGILAFGIPGKGRKWHASFTCK
jgi:hypothetical protein